MDTSPEQNSGAPEPSSQYEFDPQQNKVIGDLANAMQWVAVPLLVLGVLYLIACIFCLVQAFYHPATLVSVIYVGLVALLFLALGRWTKHAAISLQNVVSTSGRDVSHLMEALDNLRKKYSLLSIFVKIYIALIIVALIVALIMAIAR